MRRAHVHAHAHAHAELGWEQKTPDCPHMMMPPASVEKLATGLVSAALSAHPRFFTGLNFLQLDAHDR